MLQLKHMKYPSNNISLYSRVAPESENTCAWAASTHMRHKRIVCAHILIKCILCIWSECADIYVRETHTYVKFVWCVGGEAEKADLRIHLSTSCPPGSDPLFTQCAHCLLPLARHAEHFLAPVPLVQRKIPLTSTKTAFSSPRLPC